MTPTTLFLVTPLGVCQRSHARHCSTPHAAAALIEPGCRIWHRDGRELTGRIAEWMREHPIPMEMCKGVRRPARGADHRHWQILLARHLQEIAVEDADASTTRP